MGHVKQIFLKNIQITLFVLKVKKRSRACEVYGGQLITVIFNVTNEGQTDPKPLDSEGKE